MKTLKHSSHFQVLLPIAVLVLAAAFFVPNYVFAEPIISARTRVVQVALDQHPKISQYLDINSAATGYGKNACGLVAAAAAVGGVSWASTVDLIAFAAGSDYGRETGIQPSKYVAALQEVFGMAQVTAYDDTTIEKIYDELAAGNIVIVDLKVNATTQDPSATTPNYAHFARVLGVDMQAQQIYIENTLRGSDSYWTLTFPDFMAAWDHPETGASEIPDPRHAEDVTHWLVVLDGALVNDQEL